MTEVQRVTENPCSSYPVPQQRAGVVQPHGDQLVEVMVLFLVLVLNMVRLLEVSTRSRCPQDTDMRRGVAR